MLTSQGPALYSQTVHNDFEVPESQSLACFVLGFRSEEISLLVFLALHTFLDYPMSRKRKIAKLIEMEKVEISQSSVFVSHGYLQQAK